MNVFKDRKDNKLSLNHLWYQSEYLFENEPIKLSYFLEDYDIVNYTFGECCTLLFNQQFTYFRERYWDNDRDYYTIIKIATQTSTKTWSDLKFRDGYSLKKCVDYLIENKLVINDLNDIDKILKNKW